MIKAVPLRGKDQRLCRELVYAMESTRSRLAVAIAAEKRAMPRERWCCYLEMEDRMRRCLREIRGHSGRNGDRQPLWLQALRLLKQPLPAADSNAHGEAQQLCRRLTDVLEIVESQLQLTRKDR